LLFQLIEPPREKTPTLTSNNAVIPIAYHLLKRGLPSNFDQSGKYAAERKRIQQ
jgi:hypothetical protein